MHSDSRGRKMTSLMHSILKANKDINNVVLTLLNNFSTVFSIFWTSMYHICLVIKKVSASRVIKRVTLVTLYTEYYNTSIKTRWVCEMYENQLINFRWQSRDEKICLLFLYQTNNISLKLPRKPTEGSTYSLPGEHSFRAPSLHSVHVIVFWFGGHYFMDNSSLPVYSHTMNLYLYLGKPSIFHWHFS